MNKKAGIAIAAAVAVVTAGALGTSYYMGGKLQQSFTEGIAKGNDYGIKIQITSYERGAFSSTAKTVWTLDDSDEPTQFTAEHKINHGPLPLGHAAEIHTRFNLPDDAEPAIKTALNGRSPLEIATKVGWGRSSSNVMTSPAVVTRVNESDMNWGGMKIAWDMPADLKGAKGTGSFEGLEFKDAEGSVAMGKADIRFDNKQPEGQKFWTGPFVLNIAKFTASKTEDGKTSASQVEGISMDLDTRLLGDVVEMTLKTGVKSAKLEDKQADDILLDLAINNVDTGWINHVMDLSKRMKSQRSEAAKGEQAGSDEDEMSNGDLRDTMLKNLIQALARKPSVEIKRLSMRTPEGVSEFSAAIQYVGDGKKMGNLLKDLKVSVKADMPKPLMESLMQSRKRASLIAHLDDENDYKSEEIDSAAKFQTQGSLELLTKEGIFEDKDGKIRTDIVFANGEIQANGKPLSPEGTAMLMTEAIE